MSAALQQFRPERWVREHVEVALVRLSSASPSTLQRTDRAGVEQRGSRRRHELEARAQCLRISAELWQPTGEKRKVRKRRERAKEKKLYL